MESLLLLVPDQFRGSRQAVNRLFHIGDSGRHPEVSAQIIQNRFELPIKVDRGSIRRIIGYARDIAIGEREVVRLTEGIHDLHQGWLRNLQLSSSHGSDVSRTIIQDRSVTMDFDSVGGTHAIAAAAAKGDSQRAPIMNFRKRNVDLGALPDRQNGDRFADFGYYRMAVSLK